MSDAKQGQEWSGELQVMSQNLRACAHDGPDPIMYQVPIQPKGGGNVIAVVYSAHHSGEAGREECAANARRLVVCWNALRDPAAHLARLHKNHTPERVKRMEEALRAAATDIEQWQQLAIHTRRELGDRADFTPRCPSESGLEKSKQVVKLIAEALR